jgi:hypothetical protein
MRYEGRRRKRGFIKQVKIYMRIKIVNIKNRNLLIRRRRKKIRGMCLVGI